MRGYLVEPAAMTPQTWPAPFDPATPLIADLANILQACIAFART